MNLNTSSSLYEFFLFEPQIKIVSNLITRFSSFVALINEFINILIYRFSVSLKINFDNSFSFSKFSNILSNNQQQIISFFNNILLLLSHNINKDNFLINE